MQDPEVFSIVERSQIAEARRRVAAMAAKAGFGEVSKEKVVLVVSELGSNLIKHAGGGELIVRVLDGKGGIEVLALDRGGGMENVDRCFVDGFSTAGSAGTGLGAVRRLASIVDVYSARAGGTAIVARIGSSALNGFDIGAVQMPKGGEEVCGDGWQVVATADGKHSILIVDGLGHGLGAADAALAAERLFKARPDLTPAQHLAAIHDGLRGTRGAAVGVACIDHLGGRLTFAGIGNTVGVIIEDGGTRHLVSLNGTVGHVVHRIAEFSYPWNDEAALLILHSDGLSGRWDLDRYPGLARRHPAVVAGVLFRDWSRGRDDVTVVVARAHRS